MGDPPESKGPNWRYKLYPAYKANRTYERRKLSVRPPRRRQGELFEPTGRFRDMSTAALINAHTNPGLNPGYINFTRQADGTVSVILRGDPTKFEGAYICGYAADRGKPGRCTPGDVSCNNYCNMAPEKGPMQATPAACSQVRSGETVSLTLSAADYEALIAGLVG